MNDQETQMTQYVPMANVGECLKEKRLLKRDKEFPKDAFCSPAYVEISDDGKIINDLDKSDVVLVGISRTSKTPTSIYLANRGYKVSNIPMVPNKNLPQKFLL